MAALGTITPASHRSAVAHARPLAPLLSPLLREPLQHLLGQLQRSFPPAAACTSSTAGAAAAPARRAGAQFFSASVRGRGGLAWAAAMSGVQRPRLLICGREGAGQSHLAPAVLYALEGLPVHAIGLPSLLSDVGARWVGTA